MSAQLNDLFESVWKAGETGGEMDKLRDKAISLTPGHIVDIADPLNLRRIKVSLASKPGLQTDWLWHCSPMPFHDAPLPLIGQTAVCGFFDGEPHQGFWLGTLHNGTNPPFNKATIGDTHQQIPGNESTRVAGSSIEQVQQSKNIQSGTLIDLQVGNSRVYMTESGYIKLSGGGNSIEIDPQKGWISVLSTKFLWNRLPVKVVW